MYKKLLSFFTLLVVLCMGTTAKASGTYTDGDGITWITVTTAQEFSDAITGNTNSDKVCSANIRLMNDIDLDPLHAGALGSNDYLFDVTFSGRITSNEADEYCMLEDTQHTLFRELKGATIKQIFIAESSFDGRDTSSGMLADDCYNSTLENIYFYDISATGSSAGYDCDRMGIAVGKAEGCQFNDLFFIDCELMTDGEAAGFVCGSATNCTFAYCHTSVGCFLWAEGNSATPILPGVDSNAYAGGICGYAEGCSVTGCVNLGVISSDDDRIGGIIGYGKNTTVTDCRNAGLVKHCTQVGFGRESRIYANNIIKSVAFVSGVAMAASGIAYAQLFSNYKTAVTTAQNAYDRAKDVYDNMMRTKYIPQGLEGGERALYASAKLSCKFAAEKALTQAKTQMLASVGLSLLKGSYVFFAIVTSVTTLTAVSFDIYDMASKPDEMGGIVGTAEAGSKILRCVNSGAVVCADVECGGIVGYLDKSSVESCYNQGFVRGEGKTGGIAGYSNNSKVQNCLNTARVTNFNGSGYSGITGLEDNVTIGNTAGNYYLYDDRTDHGNAWSFTEADLASGWVAKQMNDNLGENPIWRQNIAADGGDFYPNMDEASGRPLVTSVAAEGGYSTVHKVYTGSQFIQAATYPNAQIVLEDDIDLSGLGFLLSDYYNPFRGTIDGQGHTIANFAYESSRFDYRNTGDGHTTDAPHHITLFPYTSGATIKDLVIDNFHISQRVGESGFLGGTGVLKEALLVGESNSSTFENIRVRNSDILINSDKEYKWIVGGLIGTATGSSTDPTYITDCTIEPSCRFQSYVGAATDLNSNLGGFVGTASHTLFTRCHNAGELWGEDDYAGGICGYAAGCGFWNCLNSGKVTCQRNVGGIVGRALSCEIKESVNTGNISGDEGDSDNDYIGGIVGNIDGSSSVKYCLGFGELNKTDEYCGGIEGKGYGVSGVDCANNHWYYYLKGTLQTDFTAENTSFGYDDEDLYSGKFAYNATNAAGQKYLYQSLDNDPFCTDLPVPIPAAGEVYQNHFCFRSNSLEYHYSNIYQSHSANEHSAQAKADIARWGFCTTCGNIPTGATVPTSITINDAADLMTLSKGVSMGVNYAHTTITLANDLDFEGITDFMPIGTSMERPFRGTFNGNGHRIKNLHIERTSGVTGVGLFGVVTGESEVNDLVMDSSCSIYGGTSLGVGGIVGCINTSATHTKAYFTFNRCGNEATVIGGENTGGLIGAVYDALNVGGTVNGSHLVIEDCYNAGTISGTKVSGALAGYGHFWISARNCYNTGTVYGYVENHPLAHYNPNAEMKYFMSVYQWDQLPTDAHAETATLKDFMFGNIVSCLAPNPYDSRWGQNIGTDSRPVLSSEKKIRHERTMANTWATAYLPFAVKSDANVQLYQVSKVDNSSTDATMTLEPVESIDANVPFFFKKLNSTATSVCLERDFYKNVTVTETATVETQAPGWSMTGIYYNQSDVTGVYFVAQDKLWYAEEPIEVPGLRAVLTYEATSSSASLRIVVNEEDESLQIGEIRDGELHFFDDGKYIENGRIVIRKGGMSYDAQGQLLKL